MAMVTRAAAPVSSRVQEKQGMVVALGLTAGQVSGTVVHGRITYFSTCAITRLTVETCAQTFAVPSALVDVTYTIPRHQYKSPSSVRLSTPSRPAGMRRDFPQELVDEVVGRLFDLVGRGRYYRGPIACPHDFSRVIDDISDYSLVSRAWIIPTQKHHLSFLNLDHPSEIEEWRACIRKRGI